MGTNQAVRGPLDLVGVAEAAVILEVSKQRVIQLAARSTFPAPVARLAAGPVWHRSEVESYHRNRSRRPGPVPVAG